MPSTDMAINDSPPASVLPLSLLTNRSKTPVSTGAHFAEKTKPRCAGSEASGSDHIVRSASPAIQATFR